MASRYMKGVPHHYLLGKCKSKPQWVITSYLLEWLLSKRQEISNAKKNVEKTEPWCTVAKNVNWYSHYGKQYGSFSKKLKIKLPYI